MPPSTLAALGASVINSTIVGNSAGGAGGGIRTPYPMELSNTIVAENARLTGEANDVMGPVTLAFSLLGASTGATITNNGGNLIGAHPLLGPLADNGGLTMTHALLAGSPAFNAGGNPAFSPPPTFDQRGAPYRRVSGGRIDIGAHERQDLTVDILDVGSPRIVPLAEVTIQFSRVVTGLDLGDLELSLNGGANLLTSGQTLATSDNRTFVLGGLQAISAASGYYTLALHASGSGIVDFGSGPLDAGDKTSWAMGRSVLGIKVNTLADERDGSLDDGDISLRDALAAAAPGEIVDFDASLDGGTILLTLGELAATRPVTIDASPLPAGIRIDASGNDPTPNANDGNGSRVLTIDDGNCLVDSPVTIHGVALTGGDTSGGGGAIHTRDTLMLIGATISGNSANLLGGGIRAFSSVTVTASRIAGNSALSGGGIFASGSVTVTSSSVSDNSAASNNLGGGGGIRVFGSATLISSAISDNSARDGRGGGVLATGSVTLSSSTISGNLAYFGGGIYTYSSGGLPGNITARDSTISGNSAQAFGGILASGALMVTSSTISGNSAGGSVGGILAVGAATITSSTISGNSAGSEGGGIWKIGYGALTLANSTVSGNSAETEGGGILIGSFSSSQMNNSIVAGNTRGASVPNDATGAVTIAFSLLGVNTDATITDNGGNLIGTAAAPIDPLLGPLADNGGPTLTHALLLGSPAINAGDPNYQPGLQGAPEFDGRGAPFTRLAGPRIDIGAFESQSPAGALTADFDFSGHTDGLDFLAWQRNFGKASAASYRQGDATADGDVDTSDFAVWRVQFGAHEVSAPAVSERALHTQYAAHRWQPNGLGARNDSV